MTDARLLHLSTNYCAIRPLEREDIPFLYDLRREGREQFLHPIPEGISHQYDYYETYLARFRAGDEIYYVIRDVIKDEDVGVVRLTDIRDEGAYNWHSLIVRTSASPQVGIDICIMFYAIGFDILGKTVCGPWPIRRSFEKMIRIHKHMKMAKPVAEDEAYYQYQVVRPDYLEHAPPLRRASFGVIKGVHDGG